MTEIVERDSSALIQEQDQRAIHELTFAELLGLEQYKLDGFTKLEKDELLGIPHVITRVTYWHSDIKGPNKEERDFVAIEATVGDREILTESVRRHWVPNVTDISTLRFSPNERVVYNDGSTGVRRQITKILHTAKLIDVGHEEIQGDARFDTPWPEWESFSEARAQGEKGNVPSIGTNHKGNPLVIPALRGLSVSNYNNDYGESVTYYLR